MTLPEKKIVGKPLAVLSSQERNALQLGQIILQQKQQELQLLNAGLQTLWNTIAKKYDLPLDCDYDAATGVVYEKAKQTTPGVKESSNGRHSSQSDGRTAKATMASLPTAVCDPPEDVRHHGDGGQETPPPS